MDGTVPKEPLLASCPNLTLESDSLKAPNGRTILDSSYGEQRLEFMLQAWWIVVLAMFSRTLHSGWGVGWLHAMLFRTLDAISFSCQAVWQHCG